MDFLDWLKLGLALFVVAVGLLAWWDAQTKAAIRERNRGYLRKPDAPATDTTPRRCLRCQKMFDSEGPGNRLCQPCKSNL